MTEGPPEVHTERLLLRPFRSDDVDDVFAYASDPEWGRYLPVPDPYTHRDAEEFVARILLADHATRPMWAVVHGGRVSGGIDLTVYGRGTAEMGYSIAQAPLGSGSDNRGGTGSHRARLQQARSRAYPGIRRHPQ